MVTFVQIPEMHAGCTFENYVPKTESQGKLLGLMRKLVESPVKGVYLHGDFGTGKTHLSVALAKALEERHRGEVAFFNLKDLYWLCFDGQLSPKKGIPRDLKELVLAKQYLFLEEVFVEGNSGVPDFFRELIERRYVAGLHNIFMNSNVAIDRLLNVETQIPAGKDGIDSIMRHIAYDKNLAGRCASRIYEMCFVYEVKGPDYRREKSRKDLDAFLEEWRTEVY